MMFFKFSVVQNPRAIPDSPIGSRKPQTQQIITRASIKKLLHEMKLRALILSKLSFPLPVSSETSLQSSFSSSMVVDALRRIGSSSPIFDSINLHLYSASANLCLNSWFSVSISASLSSKLMMYFFLLSLDLWAECLFFSFKAVPLSSTLSESSASTITFLIFLVEYSFPSNVLTFLTIPVSNILQITLQSQVYYSNDVENNSRARLQTPSISTEQPHKQSPRFNSKGFPLYNPFGARCPREHRNLIWNILQYTQLLFIPLHIQSPRYPIIILIPMHFRNTSLVLIALSLFVTFVLAETRASWVPHPSFLVDRVDLVINQSNPKTQDINYIMPNQFTVTPKVGLGVIGWDGGSNSLPLSRVSFNISKKSVTTTMLVLTYGKLEPKASNSKLQVNILLVDPSIKFINIAFAMVQMNIINVESQNQTQSETGRILLSTGEWDQSLEMNIIPFISAINMDNQKGKSIGVSLTLSILNSTHYQHRFEIDGTSRLFFVSFYRILWNNNISKASQYKITFQLTYVVLTNSSLAGSENLNRLSSQKPMSGINQFSFQKESKASFTFEPHTIFVKFESLNISVCTFKTYSCPKYQPLYLPGSHSCWSFCPLGFYNLKGENVCKNCHVSCKTCSGPGISNCTTCFVSKGEVLDVKTNKCVCNRVVDGKCEVCNERCLTCDTNRSVCTSCDSTKGFVLKDGDCVCNPNHSITGKEGVCYNCSDLFGAGCHSCDVSTCKSCLENFTLVDNACKCQFGFALTSNGTNCGSCSSIKGCIECQSNTQCTSCQSKMDLINGQCFCPSKSQFYDQEKKQCLSCRGSCLVCQDLDHCLICRAQKNLVLNSNQQCVCPPNFAMNQTLGACTRTKCPAGFRLYKDACIEICGDGLLFELECDDGNNVDGDGCSERCTIEKDYRCKNGSATTPSICGYAESLEFTLVNAERVDFSNQLLLTLSVNPSLGQLNSEDFSQSLSLNLPYSNIFTDYSDGSLTILLSLTKTSLTPSPVLLKFTPSKSPKLFAMKPSQQQLLFNLNLVQYVHDSVHNLSYILTRIFTICTVISLLMCLKTSRKIVSFELVSMIQTNYISLCMVSTVLYMPWAKLGKFVNGYNDLIDLDGRSVAGIDNIGYKEYFIENVNFMIGLELVLLVVGLIVSQIGKILDKKLIRRIGLYLYRNILLTVAIFNTINIGFSLGINLSSSPPTISPSNSILNTMTIVTSLLCHLFILYLSLTDPFISSSLFKQTPLSQRHPAISILSKLILSFILGIAYQYQNIGIIIIGYCYIYLTYLVIASPYKKRMNMVRSFVVEVSLIFHLSVMYGLGREVEITTRQYLVFGFVDILFMLASTIFSVFCHFSSNIECVEMTPLVSESVLTSNEIIKPDNRSGDFGGPEAEDSFVIDQAPKDQVD